MNTPYDFSFSYDSDGGIGGGGLLTTRLGGFETIFGDHASESVAGGLTFNAFQVNIEDRSRGDESLVLSDLKVNGMSVELSAITGVGSFSDYGIEGIGTVSDFSITGILERRGTSLGGQQSRPRLDLIAGSVARFDPPGTTAPVPLPAGVWMLAAALGGLGLARRMHAQR